MPRIRILAEQVLIRHGTLGVPSEVLKRIGAVETSLWKRIFRIPLHVCTYVWNEEGDWVQIISSSENPISSRWIIFERKNSTDRLVIDRRGDVMIFMPTGPDDSLERQNEYNFLPVSEQEVEDTISFLKLVLSEANNSS